MSLISQKCSSSVLLEIFFSPFPLISLSVNAITWLLYLLGWTSNFMNFSMICCLTVLLNFLGNFLIFVFHFFCSVTKFFILRVALNYSLYVSGLWEHKVINYPGSVNTLSLLPKNHFSFDPATPHNLNNVPRVICCHFLCQTAQQVWELAYCINPLSYMSAYYSVHSAKSYPKSPNKCQREWCSSPAVGTPTETGRVTSHSLF